MLKEKLSSVFEKFEHSSTTKILPNRMRNLHSHLEEEFGAESVFLLQQWEKYEKKIADYQNHHRFSLKCLKYDVIPVSIRLKTNIRTAKGLEIIRRAERKLLNEHIRSINNTPELYMYEKESICKQLEERLKHSTILEDCKNFIQRIIESRYQRTMARQKRKFELLYQQKSGGRSNKEQNLSHGNTSDTSKWVKNLFNRPLTEFIGPWAKFYNYS